MFLISILRKFLPLAAFVFFKSLRPFVGRVIYLMVNSLFVGRKLSMTNFFGGSASISVSELMGISD